MTNENNIYDTIVIGSGPAGLTAGIYNARADLKTVVIGGDQPGGQLILTTTIENWPGYAKGIGGVQLMMEMQEQARNLGVEIKQGLVKKLGIKNEELGIFETELQDGEKIKSKAIIIATGARAKWLGLPNEKELIGRGISGCATCDGAFFRDKIVAVVGGGDVAGEDAHFLTKFASKVYVIHRRDSFRMTAALEKRLVGNPKVEIVWNSEVTGINSNNQDARNKQDPMTNDQFPNQKLELIKIKNIKTGEEKVMPIDGLFVAIGHEPATDFAKGTVEMKETGHIIIGKDPKFMTMTSVPGIFAAGDCADWVYRQAIVAAGDGCRAAMDAERWIEQIEVGELE